MHTYSVSVCEGVLTEAVLTGVGARLQRVPHFGGLPSNQVHVCVIHLNLYLFVQSISFTLGSIFKFEKVLVYWYMQLNLPKRSLLFWDHLSKAAILFWISIVLHRMQFSLERFLHLFDCIICNCNFVLETSFCN